MWRNSEQNWFVWVFKYRKVGIMITLGHIVAIGVGLTYGLPAISNVAIVGVIFNLWFYFVCAEFLSHWPMVFFFSIFVYKAALWLHTNPEFVTNMLR